MEVRKKGVAFLTTIVITLLALMILLRDFLVEWALEAAGSTVVGARVEFEGVNLSLLNARLRWNSLQVTNPFNTWYNLFETGPAELNFALEPLLVSRFIIQNMQTDSILFNTRRSTNGALAGRDGNIAASIERIQLNLQEELETIPLLNLAFMDDLSAENVLQEAQIRTPEKVDSLQNAFRETISTWNSRIVGLPDSQSLARIRVQIDTISTASFDNPQEFARLLQQLQNIRAELDSLRRTIDNLGRELETDIAEIRQYDSIISQFIDRDIERIFELTEIPEFTEGLITRVFFAPTFIGGIQSALAYIGLARYYNDRVVALFPKNENPPRLQGQTILFSPSRNWPSLWVQRLLLSGSFFQTSIAGLARNIVSNQVVINEITTAVLSATPAETGTITLRGFLNYLEQIPSENLNLEARNISLEGMQISQLDIFPLQINTGTGSISGEMVFAGDFLRTAVSLTGKNLAFTFPESSPEEKNQIIEIIASVIRSIDQLTITSTMIMIDTSLTFQISSNIGAAISNRLMQFLSQQVQEVQAEINRQIQERTTETQQEIQSRILPDAERLQTRYSGIDSQLSSLYSFLEQRITELRRRAVGNRARELF